MTIRGAKVAAFVACFVLGLSATPTSAGQEAGKVPRVGLIRPEFPSTTDTALEAFRQGLRDLGHVEGQTFTLEVRRYAGKPDRLPDLTAELVRLRVDVIVVGGEQAIRAAKEATGTIPIVMGASNDPVGAGLVASLARPGGNITGSTILSPELSMKRLELLRELLPRAACVAVLHNPASPATALDLRQTQGAAQALRVMVQPLEVQRPEDLAKAFAAVTRERCDALIPLGDPFFTAHRKQIVDLAAKSRVPAVYYWREFVDAGGLMSYGPSLRDSYRRAAIYVDKILKGTKPADLPVEQPTRFELVINLKTARALGLIIPPSVMVRAEQVIR